MNYRDEFLERGYVVIPRHLDTWDLMGFDLAFSGLLAAMMARNGQKFLSVDEAIVAIDKLGGQGEVYDAACAMPEFLRLAGSVRTQSAIRELTGRSSPVFGFKNRCRIDMPRDNRRTYGWHQQTFYGIPQCEFVQTWGPLVRPTTLENGTIWVAVGSHREIAPSEWVERDGRAHQIIVPKTYVDGFEQVQVPMNVGDLMIFHSRLIHKSGENRSNETRFSIIGEYYDMADVNFRAPEPRVHWRGISPKDYWIRENLGMMKYAAP